MVQLIEKVTQSHTTNEWHLVVTVSKNVFIYSSMQVSTL